ncbi:hypothetical protein CRG98_010482 [Punica granatum]|uniref:Uncharacterized protein n=1 Tax=Punica granatum TaxID=22663 RepID=A0A2I0KKU2_PUNGR|nr:hypothetical protein CRG98_010482 [Punica granatum]
MAEFVLAPSETKPVEEYLLHVISSTIDQIHMVQRASEFRLHYHDLEIADFDRASPFGRPYLVLDFVQRCKAAFFAHRRNSTWIHYLSWAHDRVDKEAVYVR